MAVGGPAEQDLAGPTDGELCVKLADDYHTLAEEQTEKLPARILRERAAHWYERAIPRISDLERLRVSQRIAEIAGLNARVPLDRVIDLIPILDIRRHVIKSRGAWGIRLNQLGVVTKDYTLGMTLPIQTRGSYDLNMRVGRAVKDYDPGVCGWCFP